jgi:hypothetical protein
MLRLGHCLLDLLNRLNYRLMLPNANDHPAVLLKDRGVAAVALDVLSDLRLPIRPIRRGKCAVFGATMPEASIHKYSDLLARKDNVSPDAAAMLRLYRKIDSIPKSCCVNGSTDSLLRLGVAAAVRPHDATSYLWDITPAARSSRLTFP